MNPEDPNHQTTAREDTTAPATDGSGMQAFIGGTRPSRERFTPATNVHPRLIPAKPDGGLWTSALRDDGSCAWLDYCHAAEWGIDDGDRLYALEPRDDVDVYVIDGARDMYALLAEYERDDVPETITRMFAPLDFESIADDYDGIHLTGSGQGRTRFSQPGLYGWDSESTVWLRWVFESVDDRGPVSLDDDGGE